MTKAEERACYECRKEDNLQYIRAKIPHATPRELALIAAFIRGLGVVGWSNVEFYRSIEEQEGHKMKGENIVAELVRDHYMNPYGINRP